MSFYYCVKFDINVDQGCGVGVNKVVPMYFLYSHTTLWTEFMGHTYTFIPCRPIADESIDEREDDGLIQPGIRDDHNWNKINPPNNILLWIKNTHGITPCPPDDIIPHLGWDNVERVYDIDEVIRRVNVHLQ